MAAIDPSLMEAAGFTGAAAQQAVTSAQSKAAINTNQLNLGGEQERRNITDTAEAGGMLRSSRTNTAIGEQTAEQNNRQQLVDLGLADTTTGANLDVMQELAKQQADAEARNQQQAMFDANMALQWTQLDLESPEGQNVDWNKVSELTGGRVTGPASTNARGY